MGKMGKQTRAKKSESIGKGKITPVQIAFIVDRYLCDNSYSRTRSAFRSEASHLISKSPVHEAPKSLLSLGAILDEYITLKEQKVYVDQERNNLEQEKLRIQNLLKGMHDVMSLYNASGIRPPSSLPPPPPPSIKSQPIVSQSEVAVVTSSGNHPMYNSPAMTSSLKPPNNVSDPANFSASPVNRVIPKGQGAKDVANDNSTVKRQRKCPQQRETNSVSEACNIETSQEKLLVNYVSQSYACQNASNVSTVQGSSVVKCLFNPKVQYHSTNSAVPKTPPQSTSSQPEQCISSKEISSVATSNQELTPNKVLSNSCTIISSETIRVTPTKKSGYYTIEKNHSIMTCSPIKTNSTVLSRKENVKGRLEFGVSDMSMIAENLTPDANSTSESDIEGNLLDLDFSNLDALGLDFNFSEFLADYDIEGQGLGLPSQQIMESSPDSQSDYPYGFENADQVKAHLPSAVPGLCTEEGMDFNGSDSLTAVHSVTKCIRILSPVKNKNSLNQDNICGLKH